MMTLDLDALLKVAREFEPGYVVDRDGRVFSIKSNWRGLGIRELRTALNSHGYLRVRIVDVNGNRVSRFVHKVVAVTFLGPKPTQSHQVRHLNGNRTDNRADNLAWGTASDNAQDRKRHGREMSAINGRNSADKNRRRKCFRGHFFDAKTTSGHNACSKCRQVHVDRRRIKRAEARKKP